MHMARTDPIFVRTSTIWTDTFGARKVHLFLASTHWKIFVLSLQTDHENPQLFLSLHIRNLYSPHSCGHPIHVSQGMNTSKKKTARFLPCSCLSDVRCHPHPTWITTTGTKGQALQL